jgi:hypothetical protein
MSRPMRLLMIALIATPAITYAVYRLARGLGYLDPPATKEQEYRRTVTVALYAFLIFLPTFFYGYEKGWPRVWAIFGVINGLALMFFAAMGAAAAVRLWRLRHPLGPPSQASPDPSPPESPLRDVDLRSRSPETARDESLL